MFINVIKKNFKTLKKSIGTQLILFNPKNLINRRLKKDDNEFS